MTTDIRPSGHGARVDELAVRCGLPPTVVARWIDRGLLDPGRDDRGGTPFRVLGRVRTLARFLRAGWNAARIERALELARAVIDDSDEALTGLLASIGRQRVTVRLADGRLVEPGGQLVFDFELDVAVDVGGSELPVLRDPRDWFRIAVEAEAAGHLDEAVRAYEHALASDNAEAYFNLGNCLYAQRRRAEARQRFESAIVAEPDHAEAWNNLGIVRGELGDRDGAVAALRRALQIVPHYADAHFNLAEALAVSGDMEGARLHWNAYLSFDPNSRWAEQVRGYLRTTGK